MSVELVVSLLIDSAFKLIDKKSSVITKMQADTHLKSGLTRQVPVLDSLLWFLLQSTKVNNSVVRVSFVAWREMLLTRLILSNWLCTHLVIYIHLLYMYEDTALIVLNISF